MIQIDENMTSIALALISFISLVVAKILDAKNDNVKKHVEKTRSGLTKEKEIKRKILDQRDKIVKIRSKILLSLLRSNTMMLKYAVEENDKHPLELEADTLESEYIEASDSLKKLEEKYIMLLELSSGRPPDAIVSDDI